MKRKNNLSKKNKQNGDGFSPLSNSDVTPLHRDVVLRYSDPTLVRMNAAINWGVYTMRMNDVYDPDPAIGSGSVSGFLEYALFYQKWRVHKVKILLEAVNLNTDPINIFIYNGIDGVAPGSQPAAINFTELPNASKVLTLTPVGTGQSKGTIMSNCDIGALYGNKAEYIADENYVGNGGPSPSGPGAKLNFHIIAFSNGKLTNGVYCRLRIQYGVRFFDRRVNIV